MTVDLEFCAQDRTVLIAEEQSLCGSGVSVAMFGAGGSRSPAMLKGDSDPCPQSVTPSSSSSELCGSADEVDERSPSAAVAHAVGQLLEALGEDPCRDGLVKTPQRVARAMESATQGYNDSAISIILSAIFSEGPAVGNSAQGGGAGGLVLVRGIDTFALCRGCLLPLRLRCHVAYVPHSHRVVGLSKLPRAAVALSRRRVCASSLARLLCGTVEDALSPLGVAVVVEARHLVGLEDSVTRHPARTHTLPSLSHAASAGEPVVGWAREGEAGHEVACGVVGVFATQSGLVDEVLALLHLDPLAVPLLHVPTGGCAAGDADSGEAGHSPGNGTSTHTQLPDDAICPVLRGGEGGRAVQGSAARHSSCSECDMRWWLSYCPPGTCVNRTGTTATHAATPDLRAADGLLAAWRLLCRWLTAREDRDGARCSGTVPLAEVMQGEEECETHGDEQAEAVADARGDQQTDRGSSEAESEQQGGQERVALSGLSVCVARYIRYLTAATSATHLHLHQVLAAPHATRCCSPLPHGADAVACSLRGTEEGKVVGHEAESLQRAAGQATLSMPPACGRSDVFDAAENTRVGGALCGEGGSSGVCQVPVPLAPHMPLLPRGNVHTGCADADMGMEIHLAAPFSSLCEHHLLPFFGAVHVAICPAHRCPTNPTPSPVALSGEAVPPLLSSQALASICWLYGRRLQVQERFTRQVAEAVLVAGGGAVEGVMVVVEAHHMCMIVRGVEKATTTTSTVATLGSFSQIPRMRATFLSKLPKVPSP